MKKILKEAWLITFLLAGTHGVQAHPLAGAREVQVAQQTSSFNQEIRSFFETGRLRSEDRLLFQTPPDDAIPVSERSRSWQFIIFREGGFSFWMPPGVLSDERVVLETSLGEVRFRTLASNAEDRRHVVAYADSLTDQQVKSPKILLEAIREKVAPADEFRLTGDREVTLDSHPGRELSFEDGDEAIVMRLYLVGRRVYGLGIRYPKASPQPREARAFLNAIQLLD